MFEYQGNNSVETTGCIKTEEKKIPSVATDEKSSCPENPLVVVGSLTSLTSPFASESTSSPLLPKLESPECKKRAEKSRSESSGSQADGSCQEEAKGDGFVDNGESASPSSPLPLPEVSSLFIY